MPLANTGLFIILAIVLFAPFLVKKIEEELEFFLFVMGCMSLTITAQWNAHLIKEAFIEPVKITLAVFCAGFLFRSLQKPLAEHIDNMVGKLGLRFFIALVIVILGFLSSVITAIIASLVLVEIIHCLKLKRSTKIKIVVLACFSIGLGAALTPIGEPLSTIAIAKLRGEPYQAGFFFIFKEYGYYIASGIIAFGLLGAFLVSPGRHVDITSFKEERETVKDILIRTGKVYLFVMALIFLGRGFKPIIDEYISQISYKGLYWINMISAIVDNATLAAAEIGPSLTPHQIKAALLGLLISGGMLIPGNIPNIIAAGKLKIKSSEWAKYGVPLGLIFMALCFFLL